VFDLIRDSKDIYARALGNAITPDRFVMVAITEAKRLTNCTQQSLLGALMLSAQLGLEPGGPLGQAYLVPFGRDVTFIVGYRGLIDLARRSGAVSSIYAEAVYEGDEFTWTLGLHRDIEHKPTAVEREDPTKITHVYAVARFRDDGAEPSFVVLTRAQVEKFRSRSKAKNNGPWVTDWTAMALKTAVRRLSSWLPMSAETAGAIASDERVITRLDVSPDDFIDVESDEVPPAPPAEDGNLGEPGRSGGTPPPAANEHGDVPQDASPDVPPAGATAADKKAAAELESRRETAAYMLDEARKANANVKAFRDEHGIPADPTKWTPEQIDAVVAWIGEEPEAGS
jgi:recombination protein RecT